ncbi:hypothetical protein KC872_03585 [Candidatus Kaiserbacteria bacterium]|nr:hypothetical protein [Candidatus Kaiserbacteria bacterium]
MDTSTKYFTTRPSDIEDEIRHEAGLHYLKHYLPIWSIACSMMALLILTGLKSAQHPIFNFACWFFGGVGILGGVAIYALGTVSQKQINSRRRNHYNNKVNQTKRDLLKQS